jgi:5-methylcytosine-specific restriction enzyme B
VKLADRIRQFVLEEVVEPARSQGRATVTVVSGDVHRALGLNNRMPAVCAALDTDKFLAYARVRLVSRSGPHQSSTVTWVFALE